MKITAARITDMPKHMFDKMPEVWVTIDGKEEMLFSFYPDEISFSPDELIGLTKKEASQLKFDKDKEFLQS